MTALLTRSCLVAILCLGLITTVDARTLLPAPPKAKIGMLGKKMTVNGMPMQIRQFSSKQSEQEVIEFYKNLWHDDGENEFMGYHISKDLEPWTIITRIEENKLLTVQVKKDKGRQSSGYLSVSPLDPRLISKPGEDFPFMKGSQVLSDVISEDYGKKGRNILIKNSKSIESNTVFYRQYYRRLGWQEVTEIPDMEKAQVMQFKRLNKHVTLVLKEEAGATIINSQSVTEGFF
ncbi:MAG: hypothetical protein MI865_01945 [Proteobacteria bacterium]|nr:hypothetical protein [Pseudomonadota bacterium]